MPAVWECRSENQVPTGCCLDPAFSSGRPLTISRKPPSAFETRSIRKPRSSRHGTSCNPHPRKKCSKRLQGRIDMEPNLVTDPKILDVLQELAQREPIFHRPELG